MSAHRLMSAVAAAGVVLAVATAGSASASTADDAFIAQMKAVGISFSSPQEAAREGNQVCQELAAGKTGSQIADEVVSQTDLTSKQAAVFVDDATRIYCPQYATESA
ncbi:MAG: DUF732 domain-containing protein [Mycobacterium sp.]|uniref:DUF732 domain-containing protein n=1 Tax=Mycobacterium sp. TaxID=1785 RepID=UPI001EC01A51|nr:DUF732 domain-containing protein [Mycobacterium sp.]MBW0019131.1 DUF732 domain-containing protein [Mycobacterium sp.]